MNEAIHVSCIIDKPPPSWKDFKHTLKHKKEELTLVELDEALKFKVFETKVELQQGSMIKRFKADRGCIECIFFEYAEHFKAFRFYVIEPNDLVLINSITESRDVIFDENRFSSVPRPSLRIPNGNEDIGGSVVPKEVIEKGTRDEVSDQHSYCFNFEDDIKTFNEAMKSHDVSFYKKAINDEMDSIMGNNTWVLADLPPGCKPLGCKWIFKRKLKMDMKTAFLNVDLDEEVDLTKKFLSSKFSMKDMVEADVILGIRIKHESNGIAISQSYYIEKALKKFNYFDCTPVNTPMDTSEKVMPNNGHLNLSILGCLMYAMTCTRPDIAFNVGKLSRYISNPALAAAGKEAEWLKNLLLEIPLWFKPMAPISIRCDSAATLAKAYSQMYNVKSRHLGVRHSMIRELIMNETILWKVIQNGNGLVSVTTDTNGMIKVLLPKTTKEVVARERERKARTTLLMALPEDHLAKFHKMADAKEMFFIVSSSEGLHKGYDRFQILLSQLGIHGAGVLHEDANQKFLRSLPSSWSQVALIMRTKPGLNTLSFDDLYNNLRVFKRDVKRTTASSSSNTQNVAFMSADNTSSTNDVSTAYSVSLPSVSKLQKEGSTSYTNELIHSFFTNQSSAPQLDYDDLGQINDDDMEEMDLKWQVAMISMRIKKFHKRTGKKLHFDTKDPVGFDKTKVECFHCHKIRHFARDCRAKGNQDSRRRDGGYHGNKSRDNGSDNESVFMNKECDLENTPVNDRYAEGMHTVPPHMTGNYMLSGPDVEIDYSKLTYGPKQTSADESYSKPIEYAS
nr:hypothetical protein [Tanacetum cinerariifolium]